jgi:hypothetical protein
VRALKSLDDERNGEEVYQPICCINTSVSRHVTIRLVSNTVAVCLIPQDFKETLLIKLYITYINSTGRINPFWKGVILDPIFYLNTRPETFMWKRKYVKLYFIFYGSGYFIFTPFWINKKCDRKLWSPGWHSWFVFERSLVQILARRPNTLMLLDGSPQSHQANIWIVPSIRPRLLASTTFLIHYSFMILLHDAAQFKLLTSF